MNIITSAESAALDLEKDAKGHKSESLRHDVSKVLSRHVQRKIPSNLTKQQREAVKELKCNDEIKVYPFDKGSGFMLLTREDALRKMSEQLGDAKVANTDPTKSLLGKLQRTLAKLRKDGKFDTKTVPVRCCSPAHVRYVEGPQSWKELSHAHGGIYGRYGISWYG